MVKTMPTKCPSCNNVLDVARFSCENCSTVVEGNFKLPVLLKLDLEDQEFVVMFLKAGGSLKDLSSALGISYPTIRNKLDAVIEKIKKLEGGKK